MTLVASWAALDQKKEGAKVSSIYFAADSRFTWPDGKKYDEGLKVFCSLKHPYIFAYCGDVLFPSISLERIVYLIDCGILFSDELASFNDKKNSLFTNIQTSIDSYPYSGINFSILFASREDTYDFRMCEFCYKNNNFSVHDITFPQASDILCILGSGKDDFRHTMSQLRKNPNEGTSRYYYHCLAKTIENSTCQSVGGNPQLVGLFRKGNGIIFGIEKNGERYVLGKRINYSPRCLEIQWRNDNFEIISPDNLRLQKGAQAQPF